MAVMTLGSVADALYTLTSFIYGKRSVRFVQSPPSHTLLHDLTTSVDSGSVGPVVDSVYSAEQIAQAQQSLEDRGGFGKRVVDLS
jgi:NADPH:quinone reductase-like Zn-dependent oxidoreductase